MKQAGVADVNPGNPKLLALISAGLSDEQFMWAAGEAVGKQKGFAYALGALGSATRDAQRLPAAAVAAPVEKPPSKAELDNYRLMPAMFKGTPEGERIRKYLEAEERRNAAVAA